MTATSTVDIFCDLPGCHRWEHGSTTRNGTDVRGARARAKLQGWRVRLVTLEGARSRVDLCPAHGDFTQDSLARAFLRPAAPAPAERVDTGP